MVANDGGCGALVLQSQDLVAWNATTGELLVVILASWQWWCRVEGAEETVVIIDHKPNTFLNSKPSVQFVWETIAPEAVPVML